MPKTPEIAPLRVNTCIKLFFSLVETRLTGFFDLDFKKHTAKDSIQSIPKALIAVFDRVNKLDAARHTLLLQVFNAELGCSSLGLDKKHQPSWRMLCMVLLETSWA